LRKRRVEHNGKQIKFRETVRDLTVAIIDAGDVTIEMQVSETEFFLQRAHYYIDDVYLSNYNQHTVNDESRYSSLKPVLSLNIIGFQMFADRRALRFFQYSDTETQEQLEPVLKQIGFLELTKPKTGDPKIDRCVDFFRTGQVPADAPKHLQQAAKLVLYHNLTAKDRAVIDAAIKEEDTSLAVLLHATNKAEARGVEIGEAKAKRQVAINFLAQGLNPQAVAFGTGLPLAEVEALAESQQPQSSAD